MLSWKFKLAWGEDCAKNRKIRAKVDARIYWRWSLRVIIKPEGRTENSTLILNEFDLNNAYA